jgi:shikimate kinase
LNIVLMGFMGTGKTSVGKILAARLGWAFLDTDAMIEKDVGAPVRRIFETSGEAAFREMEERAVALAAMMDKAVISTGGGVPLSERNVRELERNGVTICLTAAPETILERVKNEAGVRPLLKEGDPLAKIRALLAGRREAYARARHQVATDGLSPERVAERVLAAAGLP